MELAKLDKGKVWKLGDNISTDLIQPGRYFHLKSNLEKLAKHVLEDAQLQNTNESFADVVDEGDYIVAGHNFGLGSSREHAPAIIKISGVRAILAKSFARIFFRNAINLGLPPIQCDTDKINDNDEIEIELEKGYVTNLTQDNRIPFKKLPDMVLKILSDGGLISHVKENQDLKLPTS